MRKRHVFNEDIRQDLNALCKYDNWHGAVAIVEDMFFIALAIALSTICPFFYPLSVFIIGARQRGLATILHEASHKILFDNHTTLGKFFNRIIGTFAGILIFQSFTSYKCSHVNLHHSHLGEHDVDPELAFYIDHGLNKRGGGCDLIKRFLIPTILGLRVPAYLCYLIKTRLLPGKAVLESRGTVLELLLTVIFWGVLIAFIVHNHLIYPFLLFWAVPYLYAFQAIGTILEVCEHYPLAIKHDNDIQMSRNRFGGCIEGFFFSIHNENYHLVHHLHPGIPFWQLKRAHQILQRDQKYFFLSHQSGGIFTRSNTGAKSILRLLLDS